MINPFSVLRWIYLGRISVAAGIFVGVLLVWPEMAPVDTLLATLLLLVSAAATLVSLWYTHLLRGAIGTTFLYLQVVFDALMVTVVVHLTGGPESVFAPLYILVIVAGALLLPFPGGLLVGALTCILYFADIVWWHDDVTPAATFLQIGLFALMALVTGLVGDRLRRTGRMISLLESELRQLRLDTSDVLGSLETGVVTVDGDGKLAYANTAAERLLQLPANDWLNRPVLEELERRLPGFGETVQRTMRRREPVQRFEVSGRVDGQERILGGRTTVLDRSGAPWVTAVVQDITDGKKVEELNRRTERLQAVAELSASLAHEIKNPLASIRSAVEQLAGISLGHDDKQVLERLVLLESDRLSRLLSQFIEFSRVKLEATRQVDLGDLCAEAVELVRQHPECQGVILDVLAASRELPVSGDPDLLHRAIFNLLLNAVQHSSAGDRVEVRLDAVGGDALPPGLGAPVAARLRVRDGGPGIPAGNIERIFDPFFTTRKGGSGLGLALVHRAVEAHRGVILVANHAGGGAEFSMHIPLSDREP